MYHKFDQFMATCFFVCWMNQNWNELWKDDNSKMETFMPPKIFYKVCKRIDRYRKDMHFSKLFWEELEDSFNITMGKNFMSKRRLDDSSFFQYSFTLDDDKVHLNYRAKRNLRFGDESCLKSV